MIFTKNIHKITKYFLFIVFVIFHPSFAQDEIELHEENLENHFWKSPRRLLYSGDSSGTSNELSLENEEGMSWKTPRRHLLYDSYSSSRTTDPTLAVYILAVIIITLLSICCKYCIKQGCEPTDDYSDAVVHPPPRTQNLTIPVAPSSGRRALNPPRSSGSIILPPEAGVFTVDFTGIENPNYNPSIHTPPPSYHLPTVPQFSTYEPSYENPTPIQDLPPSYESVMRQQNFSK